MKSFSPGKGPPAAYPDLEMGIQVTYRPSRLFKIGYSRTQAHTTILRLTPPTNKERGREFERELGGVYGRVWREEREVRNDVIIS